MTRDVLPKNELELSANNVMINLAEVSSREHLHELLAIAFQFPEYYGRNWDAFDECIRDIVLPAQVKIAGLKQLLARLPREAAHLQACVDAFVVEDALRRRVTFVDD